MNAAHRNGTNHTTAELPEPSRNGTNGVHQDTDAPSANGHVGAADKNDTPPSPSVNGSNGRDQNGHFAKGNPGGPGNPFARRTAHLRRVLTAAVTDEDIEAIANALREKAKAGDVAAAKLLLAYSIGQPTPAVDPDTLDQQEWAIFRQVPVPPSEVERLLKDVPIDFACDLARTLMPHLADMVKKKAQPFFASTPEPSKKRRRRRKRRKTRACAVAPSVGTSRAHWTSDASPDRLDGWSL